LKSFLKIVSSLLVGGVCTFLVVRRMDGDAVLAALKAVPATAVGVYLVSLAATHVFRAVRWEYLLRPIGVSLRLRQLLPISSVGFMAILALPFRLGEFVRPYYVVRLGRSRMSAVLGTVAVERIVDGLVISVLFFATYLATGATYSATLKVAAWISLLGFLTATLFLAFALAWPARTVRWTLRVTLLRRLAPRVADKVADKLLALIQGFRVLRDPGNLVPFLGYTLLYWGTNGLGMWLLATQMGLPIPLVAAFVAMSFTGVIISLPNAPGLIGQFHWGIVVGLLPFLDGTTAAQSHAVAYATLLHGIQAAWYLTAGLVSLRFVGGRRTSFRDVVAESQHVVTEVESREQVAS